MKKWICFMAVFALAVLALGTWATPVSARSYEFEIVNELNNQISVALCYYDTNYRAWCNMGWFVVNGGAVQAMRIDNIDIRKGMAYYALSNGKVCADSYSSSKTVRGWVNRGDSFRYYGSHPKTKPGGSNPQVVTWFQLPYNRDYMGITINTIPRG
jgi:hypothetical protein